jgi:DNA-binding MarR family transcriptional regulator
MVMISAQQQHFSGKGSKVPEGHELAMWLRKAYLAFHRRVNAWMLIHGITADQYVVLRVVAREPGITQIKIVQRTASDPNTVAAIVRLLERRGLLRREAHSRDGRARCVYLTPTGRRMEQRSFGSSEPLRAALKDCQGEHDNDENLEFLKRVHQAFSAPQSEANGRRPRRTSTRKAAR